ncbi:unnamed protein product [Paramecium octaurelia]|uniref:Uncharacterized protein n=1 Tax=Paramecium octaurelia TaxID=43137 RepID=A0A8S1V620_PAROT|nr:unnamed protein product [Paramecium octaurelia]
MNKLEEALQNYDFATTKYPEHADNQFHLRKFYISFFLATPLLYFLVLRMTTIIVQVQSIKGQNTIQKQQLIKQIDMKKHCIILIQLLIQKLLAQRYINKLNIFSASTLSQIYRFEDALQNYDFAIMRNPDQPNLYYWKATTLFLFKLFHFIKMTRFEETLQYLDRAIQINPENSQYYYSKGKKNKISFAARTSF